MLLKILLLIIGSTATLSAFGGKTWREGTDPVLQRVTLRGWISLACLLSALALGIFKEVLEQKSSELVAQIAEQEKQQLVRQLEQAGRERSDLVSRLSSAQSDLSRANGELAYLRNNSRYQPTVIAVPLPGLHPGMQVALEHEPFAGSRLEVLGFGCPLLVSISGSVSRNFEVAPMQHATLPVMGNTGEKARVMITNLAPRERVDQGRICSGKVVVHSVPFLAEQ